MIGFTSVSLRDYSVEQVVQAAKQAKAELIEWGSDVHIKTPEDAKRAKALCDEAGIRIASYGTYYRTGSGDRAAWKTICEAAKEMDAPVLRAWLYTKGSAQTSEKEYERIIDDARDMADEAAKSGRILCHECHPNTYNDTTESSLRFLKDVERDNVKTYYQSWYRDEEGDRDKLLRLFPYVTKVHLSFSELTKFQRFHKKDPDYIKKLLTWLRELDFQGDLIIEFTKHNDIPDLINDTERLRTLWESI